MFDYNNIALKDTLIKIGKRMLEKGFIRAAEGNISAKLNDGSFLITASGICKGDLSYKDLVTCDDDGSSRGNTPVSSEIVLHTVIYSIRPDVKAIIHAHPPYAIACSIAGISLREPILPEVFNTLGSIITTVFAAPSSPESADVIERHIRETDAIILDRHGSVTVGKDLWDAYFKLEILEFAAQTALLASSAGNLRYLSPEELSRIQTR